MSDIVLSSTTDSEAAIRTALQRETAVTDEPILAEIGDDGEPVVDNEPPPAPPKVEPPPPEPPKAAEPAEKPVEKEPEPAEKPTGVEKRIAKLTADKWTEKRRAEAALEENALLKAQLAALAAGAKAPAAAPPAEPAAPVKVEKPTVEKFKTYEEYVESLASYAANNVVGTALQAERERQAQQEQEAAGAEAYRQFQARRDEARTRYADFEETVQSDAAEAMPMTPVMQHTIMTSELGHDLAYYLAKNPDVAEDISEMEPMQQQFAMGRLAHQIELKLAPKSEPPKAKAATPPPAAPAAAAAPPAAPKAAVSKAPPPIEPVGSGSGGAVTLSDDELPYDQWKMKRNSEEAARRRGRR